MTETLHRCRKCGYADPEPQTYHAVQGAFARCRACGAVVCVSHDEAEALALGRLFEQEPEEDPTPTGALIPWLIAAAFAAAFAVALWWAP
jgi:hypothetical protein